METKCGITCSEDGRCGPVNICYTGRKPIDGIREKAVIGMALLQNNSSPQMTRCNEVSLVIEPKDGTLPLPICIEIPGGRAHEVIPAGVRLPHETTQLFSTADSHQLAAEFHLVAGSRPLVRDNIELGRVRVRDVKWAGAGRPKLEIAFDLAEDGTLTIAAANLDRKRTEMLAWLATERVTAEQVEQALEDTKAAQAHDEWVEQCIDEMLVGYALLDTAYERYAMAKKKMNYFQKRQYKTARKRLEKALNVMPPEATEETMAELREARGEFDALYEGQKDLYDAVMAWYEKK